MNRSELLKYVAQETGLDRSVVTTVSDKIFDTIIEKLKAGEHVTIAGFGRFEMRERKARDFTNPKTGSQMSLVKSTSPGFVPSSTMKKETRG